LAVEVVAAEEATLLGDQEEEEPVDQAEEEFVVAGWGHFALPERLTQVAVGPVAEEAVAKGEERLFDPLAQAFASATALLNRVLVIDLQHTLVGVLEALWETGAVEKSVEDNKVAEPLLSEDLLQVEFEVGLGAEAG